MMRIANWNVGNQPTRRVHEEISELMALADLGVFNEMADQSLPNLKGFRGVQLDNEPGLNRNPVMYRNDRLELLSIKYKLLVPAEDVGDAGAGGDTMANKYSLVLKFQDKKTKQKLCVFPVHAIPSQQIARRKRLHVKHMRGLAPSVAWRRARGNRTIVVGDFNEDFRNGTVADRYIIGKSNHSQLGALDTHGNRSIDAQIGSGLRAVSHKTLGKHGSDHEQLLVVWK